MDLEPIINRIARPSEVYFILPNTKDFDLRKTYNLMAKYHLRLLAYEMFLQFASSYGSYDRAERLLDLRRSVAAFDLQTSAEVIDLSLAKQIIESSMTPHVRTVVLGLRRMHLVADSSFLPIAETRTFRAWVYLPNEPIDIDSLTRDRPDSWKTQ